MELRVGKVVIEEREIAQRVKALGNVINLVYGGRPVTLVGVLDGCVVFLADLIRRLEMPTELVLVRVSTYGDAMTPQREPRIDGNLAALAGRNVLIVDDIYDTGRTLGALVQAAKAAGAASVRTCVFLEKERAHEERVKVDFVGLTVPDTFVIGYGLDYAGKFRNLPYVAMLDGADDSATVA